MVGHPKDSEANHNGSNELFCPSTSAFPLSSLDFHQDGRIAPYDDAIGDQKGHCGLHGEVEDGQCWLGMAGLTSVPIPGLILHYPTVDEGWDCQQDGH